ncbi:MAG TPA: lysophospholipid acyltransferase family protein [Candidatus Eisenbacteria bacterium]
MTTVRSLVVWILCFVVLIFLGTPFLILSLFDNGGVRIYPISVLYMRCVAFLAGLKVRALGKERVPFDATYVLMSNHRSWFDITAIMIATWPMQIRFVAKKELADIPLFGACIKRGGHVMIDRKDRDSAIRTLRETARKFAGRFSIVVFPEGTRSPNHALLPFKRGGFHLARELNIPVVPVSVVGGDQIMKRGTINLYPGTMRVMFHAPLLPSDYTSLDELQRAVRERIGAGLGEMGEFTADAPKVVAAAGVDG